jgi:hypothetical protein
MADPFLTDAAIMGSSPEAFDIQRQRKLAELLTANSFTQPQGQMISGHYVAPSWTQQLAPLASALAGSHLGSNIDKKQEALAQQLRGKQEAEIEKYASLQNDPASQLRFGMSATNPLLKDLVKKRLEGTKLSKDEILYKENIGGQNTTLEGKPDLPEAIKYAISIGQLPQDPRTWTPQQAALAERINLTKANAGANRQMINVSNQLPFKEQIQKEAASGLMKNFETLQNIPSTLKNMDKMIQLSKQPIYGGVGGEAKLQIAKLFNNNFGTNISPETVKNTEEFKSAAYMGIMENLKKTDSNPTMAQQNALKEAIGSLGTDPSAVPRVVGVMRDVLINKAEQHNSLVQQTIQKGVDYPYSIEVPLPKTAPAQQGNDVRSAADAILNRKPR